MDKIYKESSGCQEKLMFGNYSLQLCNNGKPVFSSKGKWLYPLFELEQFLISSSLDPKKAELHDKIVGRAAALLIIRMGKVLMTGVSLLIISGRPVKIVSGDFRQIVSMFT